MLPRRTDRERSRRTFLHALATGRSVSEAAGQAGISRATLYAWRQDSAAFSAAWDRAALRAQNALFDRMQSALIQRGIEGVDEPVFHAGRLVGTRKRYSDTLLLAGMRQVMALSPVEPEYLEEPKRPAAPLRPRIVVAPFPEFIPDERQTPPSIAAPETKPAEEEPAKAVPELGAAEPATPEITAPPPAPAEERALDWSHLGRH